MDKHGKRQTNMSGLRIATLIVAIAVVLVGACVAVVQTGLLDSVASVFAPADPTETVESTTSSTQATTTVPPEPDPEYAFPEEMKGVWLTPDVDYLTSHKNTAKIVKEQIDAAFAEIEKWGFNTLLLPMDDEGEAVYTTQLLPCYSLKEADGKSFEPLQYILSRAREKKLYVYGVIDLHAQDELWDLRKAEDAQRVIDIVTEQAQKHLFDGFFVSGYSFTLKQTKDDRASFETALNTLMPKIVSAIRGVNRDFYVGLLSSGVWAHKRVDERGSNTDDYYEEYTDGAADTLAWVKQGLFNCVMVQNYTSTTHPTAPFQKVLDWWDAVVAETNIPLYISHSANTIGSYKAGWKLTDQLAQQYLYCKAAASWKGSAYDSLTALKNDKLGLADALKKAYDGTLNEDFIYKSLTITSPKKTTQTVTNSTVKFEGGGDTNFPLTINGEAVELSAQHGFFTQTYDLKIGVNTFEFSHKGVTRTYKITYKQTLLESVSPKENMKVDGSSPFVIDVVARIGSTVKATLGKQTITLTPVATKEDENTGTESDFQTFSGTLQLPNGIRGKEQALGTVSVKAEYNGLSESMNGGKITVNALPVITTTTTTSSSTGGSLSGSGVGGTATTTVPIPLPDSEGNYEIVVITRDYAETFTGALTDDYSRPYNSYLPQGTWDYLAGKVYKGSYSYYLLASGKRVYMKDAKVITAGQLKEQELKGGTVSLTDSHTVLTFETDWRIPVYQKATPQKYYKDTTSGEPNYLIQNYGQTAEQVELTFHYVKAVPEAPDMTDNPLFSKAEWKKVNDNTYQLILTLRKKGGFYGFSPLWSEDGKLTISFLNPVDLSANPPAEKLKGIRILIDPGHGSPDDKPWEAPFNLEYANTLKEKLVALGATVDMTRTGPLTTDITLPERASMTHNKQYHMFISVHMNGANGKATGATVWHYHEYGYTASKAIYTKMREVEVTYGVGTETNGTPRWTGTPWGTLYLNRTIHDCPAVILECAFLDNPKDKEALVDPVYRDKLMQAVTDGVVMYFEAQKQ